MRKEIEKLKTQDGFRVIEDSKGCLVTKKVNKDQADLSEF